MNRSNNNFHGGEEDTILRVPTLEKDEKMINWLELPKDILSLIFIKLGGLHTRYTAGRVCASWRLLSKQPHFYRSLNLDDIWDIRSHPQIDMELMAREAVVRSHGQLTEFTTIDACSANLLRCVIEKSKSLESLTLCESLFSKKTIAEVGRLCPDLKYFQSSGLRHYFGQCENDELVFAIAENMPQLLALHLTDVLFTNSGLRAILDGCPHLECLDVGECLGENLSKELMKQAAELVKCLRLPMNYN